MSETQREDRCGALSRRNAILPRDARRSRELDGGTGTVTQSQLSRIRIYRRSLLQSQILSATGYPRRVLVRRIADGPWLAEILDCHGDDQRSSGVAVGEAIHCLTPRSSPTVRRAGITSGLFSVEAQREDRCCAKMRAAQSDPPAPMPAGRGSSTAAPKRWSSRSCREYAFIDDLRYEVKSYLQPPDGVRQLAFAALRHYAGCKAAPAVCLSSSCRSTCRQLWSFDACDRPVATATHRSASALTNARGSRLRAMPRL